MSKEKLKSKNIRDPKKLKYYVPFSFLSTTTLCPELTARLYCAVVVENDHVNLKKTSFVSIDYEKYCNTFQYAIDNESSDNKSSDTKKDSTTNLSRGTRALKRICPPLTIGIKKLSFHDVLKYKLSDNSKQFALWQLGLVTSPTIKPSENGIKKPNVEQSFQNCHSFNSANTEKELSISKRKRELTPEYDIIVLSDDEYDECYDQLSIQNSNTSLSSTNHNTTFLNESKRSKFISSLLSHKNKPHNFHETTEHSFKQQPNNKSKPFFFGENAKESYSATFTPPSSTAGSLKQPVDDSDVICLDDSSDEPPLDSKQPTIFRTQDIPTAAYITGLLNANTPLVICSQVNLINNGTSQIMPWFN